MVHEVAHKVSGKGKGSGPLLNYQDRHILCTQETSSEGQRGKWDTVVTAPVGLLESRTVLPSEAGGRAGTPGGLPGSFPKK